MSIKMTRLKTLKNNIKLDDLSHEISTWIKELRNIATERSRNTKLERIKKNCPSELYELLKHQPEYYIDYTLLLTATSFEIFFDITKEDPER